MIQALRTDAASGTVAVACASCGGGLVYAPEVAVAPENAAPGTGLLHCAQCGAEEKVETGGEIAARPVEAALALEQTTQASARDGLDKQVTCPKCGGGFGFTDTLATTTCRFCGAGLQRSDIRDAPGRPAIDGIVPLAVHPDCAEREINVWMKREWKAPGMGVQKASRGPLSTVYLPYFVFDADVAVTYRGERAENESTDRETGTTTYSRWRPIDGTTEMRLSDIVTVADGSAPAQPKWLDFYAAKELHAAVPFQPELLAGALCRLPDRNLAEGLAAARPHLDEAARAEVGRKVGGFDQRYDQFETSCSNQTYRQILFPFHTVAITVPGRPPKHVWVNGVNGHVVGDKDPRIDWFYVGGITLIMLVFVYGMLREYVF